MTGHRSAWWYRGLGVALVGSALLAGSCDSGDDPPAASRDDAARDPQPGCAPGSMRRHPVIGRTVLLGCGTERGGDRIKLWSSEDDAGSCLVLFGLPGGPRSCGRAPSELVPPNRRAIAAIIQPRPPRAGMEVYRPEVSGETAPSIRRVVLRFSLPGRRPALRTATLIRVTERRALRAAGIRRPFGYFFGLVPPRATRVSVKAFDGLGAVRGRLRSDRLVTTHPTALRPARAPGSRRKLRLRRNRHGGIYMGVTCREPNTVTCDRIGVAVWLARPAKTLTAEIEGRPLTLVSPGEFVEGRGTGWEGYLQPAGLREPGGPLEVERERGKPEDYWSGVKPVEARVRLRATYRNGATATTTLTVPLRAGWG